MGVLGGEPGEDEEIEDYEVSPFEEKSEDNTIASAYGDWIEKGMKMEVV